MIDGIIAREMDTILGLIDTLVKCRPLCRRNVQVILKVLVIFIRFH